MLSALTPRPRDAAAALPKQERRRREAPQKKKMASLLGYGKSDDRISVTFDGDAQRPRRRLSPNATPAPVFAAVEPVTGVVEIRVPAGKRLEHQGIKIECVGQIELFHDRGTYYDFTCVYGS